MTNSTATKASRLTVLRRGTPAKRTKTQSKKDPRVARVRPYTEAQYEKHFAGALLDLGVFSYHTAERFYLGIPDRYVAGGRWIEFKQVKWMGKRVVSPIRQLSSSQINTLDKFTDAGDKCWVAVLFQTPEGDRRSLFMPWQTFRGMKPQWEPEQVRLLSMPYDHGKVPIVKQISRSGFLV